MVAPTSLAPPVPTPAYSDAPPSFTPPPQQKGSSNVPREGQPNASDAAPLDSSLFVLSEGDLEFLHSTVSDDDDELKSRIFGIQKRLVVLFFAMYFVLTATHRS